MANFEQQIEVQNRTVRRYGELTRNHIENGGGYDLAGDDMPRAVVDVLREEVDCLGDEGQDPLVFLKDMGENYPGASIKGYTKKVYLGNADGGEIFTLFDIGSVQTGEPLGLVIEDEREGLLTYWRFNPEQQAIQELMTEMKDQWA